MIKEIVDTLDIDFTKAIIDNYKLKNGLYVRVGIKLEYFIYKSTKKDSSPNIGLKDLNENIRASEYEWFARRDYVSVYLNSNKAIDPPKKKIHNNNYLTLFVKAKEFNEDNKIHFIEKLYENLKDFKSFAKKEEVEVIKSFNEYIFDENRQKDIEFKKKKFLDIFDDILEHKSKIKESDYIKIFFDEDFKEFKRVAKQVVTRFATNSKYGCDNEFALFVEYESEKYLPDLSEYIKFDSKNKEVDLSVIEELVGDEAKVEVYADIYKLKVKTKWEIKSIF